jgi:hypothetical protein
MTLRTAVSRIGFVFMCMKNNEVRYWTKELNVTREELERAVRDVGVMAADVGNTWVSEFQCG